MYHIRSISPVICYLNLHSLSLPPKSTTVSYPIFVDYTSCLSVFFLLCIAPIPQIPRDVQLTRVGTGQLTFTWTLVNSSCLSINYMATLDCGTCSVAMDTTTAICSGLQLPSVCNFTVQTLVCGEVGAPSDTVTVILRGIL